MLNTNLEAKCFKHAKKGIIKEATAIVNLKSNYKWTDRNHNDNNNSGTIEIITPEQRAMRIKELKEKLNDN